MQWRIQHTVEPVYASHVFAVPEKKSLKNNIGPQMIQSFLHCKHGYGIVLRPPPRPPPPASWLLDTPLVCTIIVYGDVNCHMNQHCETWSHDKKSNTDAGIREPITMTTTASMEAGELSGRLGKTHGSCYGWEAVTMQRTDVETLQCFTFYKKLTEIRRLATPKPYS